MMEDLLQKLVDQHFLLGLLIAVAAGATVLTIAIPLLDTDMLGQRMKTMATERERIRAREREKLAKGGKGSLRPEAKAFMSKIVESFSASKWLGTDKAKLQLAMAGHRGPQAEVAFLFFRLVTPACCLVATFFYLFFVADFGLSLMLRLAITIGAAYLGIKAPEIFLSNTISKRQQSVKKAFPDTLDLLLICVESGMSLEHAARKVAQEIGPQSIPMAEELTLVTAELSYLSDRRLAFENFALRTGVESVRALVTVLIQAERYGTPLGAALRTLSQESRDMRMMEAEKKAASLPPKLTVPMIVFFLPVLFVIIATPAAIQVINGVK
ncbi:MAG TPA: type II secretion system F family protein [Lichenihabitans sp.]|jgi:tight adherence protein C|nr:type II secretion system F family protein [Lichenihabitans sp.]